MNLKIKYWLFILFLNAFLAIGAYFLFKEHIIYFFLVEVLLILLLIWAYSIYRSFIRPFDFLYTGVNAIKDQDFNVTFRKVGSPEMDKLIEVYNGMIENIRKERVQVQEQHYFLEKLINASPTGILILDYDNRLTSCNPKALKILNLEENWQSKTLTAFNQPIFDKIAKIPVGESLVLTLHGTEQFKFQVSTFLHRGFERKFILIEELSKEILQAEKRAYGKVIRMMAHEVNNSIGAINSILHSTVEVYEHPDEVLDQEVKESLNIAIRRNERLNQFMKNFAEVVRLPHPFLERTDLNELLQNMIKLMQGQANEQAIQLHLTLPPQTVYAIIDAQQMEQVLVNILKNAMESIENKGVIEVLLTAIPKKILIKDNGKGIEPEVAEAIFTPFYSTKTNGQGIGLTLIREILTNHQAQFSLETKADGWTVFEIAFE